MRAKFSCEVKSVSLLLSGKHVLNEIGLAFESGELVALIGPNGAGKSSLLRVLAGELQVTQGEIYFCGNALGKWDIEERAKRLAVLPQSSSLSFPYTVEEVVKLARLPHASGCQRDSEIVDAALEAMDLLSLRKQIYTQLSGGEKQRTQLARVLAQIWPEPNIHPSLLLLDEPCSALDPGHADLLTQQLKAFCRLGATVVMVLHDVNFASLHASRIIALDKGEVIADGKPENVINTELLNALFSSSGHVFKHPILGYPVYL